MTKTKTKTKTKKSSTIQKQHKLTRAIWGTNDGQSVLCDAYVIRRPVFGLKLMVHELQEDEVADKNFRFSCSEMSTGWFIGRGDSMAAALYDAYLNIKEYGADNIFSILAEFWEHYPIKNLELLPADYRDMAIASALIRETSVE